MPWYDNIRFHERYYVLRMNVFVLPVYFEYTPRFWNPISFFIYYWMESLIDVEFTCVFHT